VAREQSVAASSGAFLAWGPGALVQTNPIRRAGTLALLGASCETKPIASRRVSGQARAFLDPCLRRGDNGGEGCRVKRSQFGQARLVWRTDGAKQTQFPADEIPLSFHYSTIPASHHSNPMPAAPNEANFQGAPNSEQP
jgi:hypothetical protein